MENYELSKAADKDFEDIFEYGIDTFGLDQALAYQAGMKQRFAVLAKQPKLYQAVEEFREGYLAASTASIQSITGLNWVAFGSCEF
ncbi:MAG: hypothetical protein NPIRA05_14350 [Nitrospirales bacterium]|nr:MAG: hypothetical protein NPIRA05_14350 [Nitrospirales bacterium]